MNRTAAVGTGDDVFDLIRRDHEAVRALFERMQRTPERASRERVTLFAELRDELLSHSRAEQDVFYQALAERIARPQPVLEAFEEHAIVDRAVDDLEACAPDDERWLAKLAVLKELVEHHQGEEESELFRLARQALSPEEALELGEAMQMRKDLAA